MENKYKIKHKWYQHLFFKYKYKKVETTTKVEIEEAFRYRYIWAILMSLVSLILELFICIYIGLVEEWPDDVKTAFKWSNKDERDLEVNIYTFDKEVNADEK